jgi:adenosylcobyric acid synthase
MAKALMIQGTGSHVGKSVITAGLCRIFRRMGLRVAPFKSQNMALNSFITSEGGEMGRAQVYQAEAAGVEPSVLMNPVLLKANSDTGAQVIVKGRVVGNMDVRRYHAYKDEAFRAVRECYEELSAGCDVVVIEGAGSPAEVNLKQNDIVNMMTARMAGARVFIVSDIDRGGVFASIVGTMEILDPEERGMVSGFIINKFRGDASLLDGGLSYIKDKTGKPVVGVVPYFTDIHIQEEDGVALAGTDGAGLVDGAVDVAVLRLGHISNFTDFDPLASENGVKVRYARSADELGSPHVVIIPGSKNTVSDMLELRKSGMEAAVKDYHRRGGTVVGICGGYQMLGMYVHDPHGVETQGGGAPGMGLLDVETTLEKDKVTRRISARMHKDESEPSLTGYEIHMGRTVLGKGLSPMFDVFENGSALPHEDGAVSADSRVWGTYIHGIFENDLFRNEIIGRYRHGTQEGGLVYSALKERGYDMLADHVQASLDMRYILEKIGL